MDEGYGKGCCAKDSANSANSAKGGGNTKTPPLSKAKQINPTKRWCWTLNNYSEDDISAISAKLLVVCKVALFGAEVGDEGTPHLQGYCEFITKCRPKSHSIAGDRIH